MIRLTVPLPLARVAVLGLFAFGLLGAQPASAAIIDTVVYNGRTFHLISENSATGAEAEAQTLGGHLATIDSQALHSFLWSTWGGNLGSGLGLWIGLTDQASEGTFVWLNGQPVSFTNWVSGEPNSGFARYEEDFVNMDSRFSPNGKWNDVPDAGPGWNAARGIVEVAATEPSTLVLLGTGLAGVLLRRRRRRNAPPEA
jgi:hypothetical protein